MKSNEKQWKAMKSNEKLWKAMKSNEKVMKSNEKQWKRYEKIWKLNVIGFMLDSCHALTFGCSFAASACCVRCSQGRVLGQALPARSALTSRTWGVVLCRSVRDFASATNFALPRPYSYNKVTNMYARAGRIDFAHLRGCPISFRARLCQRDKLRQRASV